MTHRDGPFPVSFTTEQIPEVQQEIRKQLQRYNCGDNNAVEYLTSLLLEQRSRGYIVQEMESFIANSDIHELVSWIENSLSSSFPVPRGLDGYDSPPSPPPRPPGDEIPSVTRVTDTVTFSVTLSKRPDIDKSYKRFGRLLQNTLLDPNELPSDWELTDNKISGKKRNAEIPPGMEERGKKQKKTEKCQNWPNCEYGEGCNFVHPTLMCKNLPNCPYGDKCLFLHGPPRRSFAPRGGGPPHMRNPQGFMPQMMPPLNFGAPPMRQYQQPAQPCRFGFSCRNKRSGCPYSHPDDPQSYGSPHGNMNPMNNMGGMGMNHGHGHTNMGLCKYGMQCTRQGCTFSHFVMDTHDLSASLPLTPPPVRMDPYDASRMMPESYRF